MNWATNELIDHIINDENLYELAKVCETQEAFRSNFQFVARINNLPSIDWKAVHKYMTEDEEPDEPDRSDPHPEFHDSNFYDINTERHDKSVN